MIDGAIRDVGTISAGSSPVSAGGVSPRGPYKNGPGEINVPVSIGGMGLERAGLGAMGSTPRSKLSGPVGLDISAPDTLRSPATSLSGTCEVILGFS